MKLYHSFSGKKISKEKNMKYVGIDLHTNRFTCCFLDEKGTRKIKTFELNETDMALFYQSVDPYKTYVLIEATVNSFAFVQLIKKQVKEVIVANTFQLKQISFTNKKTDKIDAYKLARILKGQMMSGEEQVHRVVVPPQHIQDIRALFTTYRLMRKQICSTKNRIHSLLKQNLKPFTKEYIFGKKSRKVIRELCKDNSILDFQINFLFDQLEQLEAQVKTLKEKIKEEGRHYLKEIDILTSMRGISVFIAIAIIADIITVKRFSNSKKFASYLRSTPKVESSNEKTIIKSTNKAGRKVAITLLSQALNHYRDASPQARRWHDRLRLYKKAGVVRMGLCRRMITEIYQMLKKEEYHYFRDKNNHRKKMDEYCKFLIKQGVMNSEKIKQSA
jgi:transposase